MTAAKGAGPEVLLDLDVYEPEAKDVKKPFVFKHAGRVYSLPDPRDALDWNETVGMSHPATLMSMVMSPEDRTAFLEAKGLTNRKFAALLERWMRHMGVNTDANGSPVF